MLILLPPSEGKRAPTRGKPLSLDGLSFPSLTQARGQVLDALVALCTTDSTAGLEKAAGVLGVGRTLTDEVARNAHLRTAPTVRADRLYTGVLYDALDLASLPAPARRRATARLAITSALFGLLRPGDAIPAYRLSGGASLPGIGNVSTFWGHRLHAAVSAAAGAGLVLDLRSSAYTPFWRPDPDLAQRVVSVRVLHEVAGRRKVVSHFNKATKGRLVRSLLEDGARPRRPQELAEALTRLGWQVEDRGRSRHGTGMDVVVREL
ncbi:MAG TPA: peroxide stress protein YaaA [Nocardioidaceae bacterium]